MLKLYTDGSCTNNGRKGARAGYSVVFPDFLEHSWGDSLGEATNQTAELTAIYQGFVRGQTLMGDPEHIQLRIFTESEYSINCLTKWVAGWKKRDWKTADGKPVVHRELVERIITEVRKYGSHIFTHVKAHTGGADEDSKWNQIADDLAREAVEAGARVQYSVEQPVRGETTEFALPGIPLALVGAPVSEKDLLVSIRNNLDSIDASFLHSALISALKKTLQARKYQLDKTKIHKTNHYRIVEESHVTIHKLEDE
jgi:ribonuclease HI